MTTVHAPASRGAIAITLGILTAGGALASEPGLEAFAGSVPPPVPLVDPTGARIATPAAQGDFVLLHFFATWCEPCRPELASLDRLAAEEGGRGVTVFAVSVAEPPGRVARFLQTNPVRFPVALDEDRAVARSWRIDSLPSTVVIDRSGRPRLIARRDLDWRDPGVVRALEPLLAEAGGPLNNKAQSGPEGGK